MKEQIVACLAHPYLDKYVVKVIRQLDRFHVPTERIYSAYYTNPNKIYQLMSHFLDINAGIQSRITLQRIREWKEKTNESNS